MSGSRERYLTAGFSDYLEKPVRANRLLETIARHVASHPDGVDDTAMTLSTSAITGNAGVVDLRHLDRLREQLSTADIDRMISNMEAEFEFDLRRLKIAVGLSDREACHQALQALADDALQIGAVGLADYSRKLSVMSEDIDTIFASLSQLQLAAARAVSQLRGHVAAESLPEVYHV